MPKAALTKLPTATLKSYIGRLFSLRKHKEIFYSMTQKDGNKTKCTRDKFPECVFVLDESHSKVRVFLLDSTPVWIPKYFLYKEVEGTEDIKKVESASLIQTLISIMLKPNMSPEEKVAMKTSISIVKKHLA